MSPWPAVVIQGVFVEQANSVCYLLCTIFISENCIVSPFGEKVMEWGGKQRVCHSPGFWWCCTTRLRGSHILPVILTLNQTCQHTERVRFLNQNEKELRAIQATVYLRAFEHVRWLWMYVTLPSFPIRELQSSDLAGLVNTFFTHTCAVELDGGDAAFWSHLTSTATAHLAHAPWS